MPPPRGARRSAADSVYTATAATETVITVERLDKPGDAERRRPAPEPPAALGMSGTATSTKEDPPVSTLAMPSSGAPAAEHVTEVTLDDVLDALADSKDECFTTYDECAVLADKARKLRDSLQELAEELAERHNVIGRLTSAAMTRLAESMDLLARKADEMRTKSLAAAEAVENAHDEMHDAYRPVQQAAADAGLRMPSARIHNED
ncbi:hypothetical protein [Streptomyces fradiae]|uniref:hypothetical protein n=1 Tax=Streptomyces fradiae TaxID=1906 RepID=UPI0036BB495B